MLDYLEKHFQSVVTVLLLIIMCLGIGIFAKYDEDATQDAHAETPAKPSEENESRILFSDEVNKESIWFKYAYDTVTEVCSLLIANGGGYRPQVIECTPEVMRLFPENPAEDTSTEADQ